MQPLVILTRTNRVESIHKGYICIGDKFEFRGEH